MVSGSGPTSSFSQYSGIDRRQFVEALDVLVIVGRHAVDVGDFAEPGALLAAARLHHAVDEQPLAQPVLLDHASRHERIGHFAGVVVGRAAEKAVAVGVQFEDSAAGLDRAGLAVVGGFDVAVLAVVGRSAGKAGRAADDSHRVDWDRAPVSAARTAFLPFGHIHKHLLIAPIRGCTNASQTASRTNSQVPKIGRPSWEPGIPRQEVTSGAATKSAPLLSRLLSGGTPRTFCRSTAESLGREATLFPRRDQSLLRGSPTIPDLGPKAPTCQAELKQWLS